jgi:polysulfide reductase chain C
VDVIWGSTAQYTEIAWGWPIAIYLFLAGLSAGALITALIVKRLQGDGDTAWDGLVKAGALLAPLTIIVGQVLLIFDLGKPLSFYLLLLNYQLGSVMSIGVILLALYTPLTLLFAVVVFQEELSGFGVVVSIAEKLEQAWFEGVNLLMAVAIASYTGFLLSAMVAKPLLNIAVLPLLFLVSGLSVGVAASIMLGLACFKDTIDSDNLRHLLNIDFKIILFEAFVLFLMFTGLYYHGGNYAAVAQKALTVGVWAKVFWLGVVGLGLVVPIVLSITSLHNRSREQLAGFGQDELAATTEVNVLPITMLMINSAVVITGGILLRMYVLYAGQIFF